MPNKSYKRVNRKTKKNMKGGDTVIGITVQDLQTKIDNIEKNMPICIGKIQVAVSYLTGRTIPFYVPKNISLVDFRDLFSLQNNSREGSLINLSAVYLLPNIRGLRYNDAYNMFTNGGDVEDGAILRAGGDFNLAERKYPGLFVR